MILQVAEDALESIKKMAIDTLSAAQEGLREAIAFLKRLTSYTFQSVGFQLTNEIKPLVDLNVKVTNTETGVMKKHEFQVNLDMAELKALAKDFFKNIFKAVQEQAMRTLNKVKDKVMTRLKPLSAQEPSHPAQKQPQAYSLHSILVTQ